MPKPLQNLASPSTFLISGTPDNNVCNVCRLSLFITEHKYLRKCYP